MIIANNSFLSNSIKPNIYNLGSIINLNDPGNVSLLNSLFEQNSGIMGTCIYYSELSKII